VCGGWGGVAGVISGLLGQGLLGRFFFLRVNVGDLTVVETNGFLQGVLRQYAKEDPITLRP